MAKKRSVNKEILFRANIFYSTCIVIIAVIALRLVWIQYLSPETDFNSERIHNRIFRWGTDPAHRGSILSRNGEPLATSVYNYQVEMDYSSQGFDSMEIYKIQTDSLSKLLSRYFKDKSAKQYYEMMHAERRSHYQVKYVKDTTMLRNKGWFSRMINRMWGEEYITQKIYDTLRNDSVLRPLFPRQVDYSEWQTLRQYPILNMNMGLTYKLTQTDSRIYPQGEMARRTIGKLMGDKGTDFGIEAVYSSELAPHNGTVYYQRIAHGFQKRVENSEAIEPKDGCDVVTTIDINIQDVVSRSLYQQLHNNRATWGTTIVMEVETGDIVAIANLGLNPAGEYVERRNYAIGARMEPGSTFKLAAMMALLDVGNMSPEKLYDSGNGEYIKLGSAKVRDSHAGYHEVNLKTAVAQSLNGYFASAVYDHFNDEPLQYVEYLRTLHLDRTVGFDEFGALKPIFRTPNAENKKLWTPNNTIAILGYGYGIEITPMHTITLYNAVANGGKMVAPRLISEIRDENGVVEEFPVEVLNPKICSNSTLKIVKECLEETARTGTASSYLGKFNNFTVGAKTGTAQIAQGGDTYGSGYYLGSMVSYMPADNPRYTVLTALYTRRGDGRTYYGAGLAGNVQREVVQFLYNNQRDWFDEHRDSGEKHYPTKIKGGELDQIQEVAAEYSPHKLRSDANQKWGRAKTDSLYNVEIEASESDMGIMPNVNGMGLKDALFMLESRGLKVSFRGEGAVYSQSIAAGRKIARGSTVNIALR